jgi:hypothetical protein
VKLRMGRETEINENINIKATMFYDTIRKCYQDKMVHVG